MKGRAPSPFLAGPPAALLGALARVRERRVFHPHGVGFEGELIPRGEGGTGHWRQVAVLRLGTRLPADRVEELNFSPAHTGGGLEPIGFFNRVRPPAYAASQEGRREAEAQL